MLFMGTMYLKLIFTATYILNVIGNKIQSCRGCRATYIGAGGPASLGNSDFLFLSIQSIDN